MKAILFFLAVVVGAVRAWPQGQPNCAVAGNWSDPERKDKMLIATGEVEGRQVQQVVFNSSGLVFNGSAPFEDGRTTVLRVTSGNESLLLNIICYNNVMWIMQTPLLNSRRMIRVFTLTRLAPPQPQPFPIQQDPVTSPAAPPRYLLVNITIPKRSDDDLLHFYENDAKNEASVSNNECEGTSERNDNAAYLQADDDKYCIPQKTLHPATREDAAALH